MTRKPVICKTSPIIRRLSEVDRADVLAHFGALPQEDQRLRFGHAAGDVISNYVSDIDLLRDHLFAAHDAQGRIVGLAHVPMRRNVAELGLSILPAARRQGLGRALARHALQAAARAGARAFRIHFASSNEAMRRIAASLGMRVGRDGSDLVAQLPLAAARFRAQPLHSTALRPAA
jgi:GNAT superfamily N-acetyltransferase